MRRLGAAPKQAKAISEPEEEKLWSTKQLGDFNPRVLMHTILYLNGLHFGLRGGSEHRRLRFRKPQVTLVEEPGQKSYLRYLEDVSKTSQGGLKHRRVKPKDVIHYANVDCPERCHVRLYTKYMELSPKDKRDEALYLQPLRHPKSTLWYSRQAVGANTLARVVKDMCEKAGIPGTSSWSWTDTNLHYCDVDSSIIQ
jgi:hypothetical protein